MDNICITLQKTAKRNNMKEILKKPSTWVVISFVFLIICIVLGFVAPCYAHQKNYELWRKLTDCQVVAILAQVLSLGVAAVLDITKK